MGEPLKIVAKTDRNSLKFQHDGFLGISQRLDFTCGELEQIKVRLINVTIADYLANPQSFIKTTHEIQADLGKLVNSIADINRLILGEYPVLNFSRRLLIYVALLFARISYKELQQIWVAEKVSPGYFSILESLTRQCAEQQEIVNGLVGRAKGYYRDNLLIVSDPYKILLRNKGIIEEQRILFMELARQMCRDCVYTNWEKFINSGFILARAKISDELLDRFYNFSKEVTGAPIPYDQFSDAVIRHAVMETGYYLDRKGGEIDLDITIYKGDMFREAEKYFAPKI
jgi:hypothetical protein